MICPSCGQSLEEQTYEGIQIDACATCGGVWLDDGELEEIVQRRDATFSQEQIDAVPGAHKPVTVKKEEMGDGYKCPKCGVACHRSNYAYTSGIIIDKCPNRHGIWLDESELEKIQIVVEEWEKKRAADTDRLGPQLSAIEQDVARKSEESLNKVGRARMPIVGRLVNGLVRGIVAFDG